ncbi:hypothetical protein HCUR_00683 [Holospora curviuscula]|uniref:Uncharacterized protein n=1 Tax=Holospora curviuscula TaxID=1082868 RepID=A0A2S5R9D1_9PROT|nr:hypothetical protein HCUR_00683 [Holospora curviuscula]
MQLRLWLLMFTTLFRSQFIFFPSLYLCKPPCPHHFQQYTQDCASVYLLSRFFCFASPEQKDCLLLNLRECSHTINCFEMEK